MNSNSLNLKENSDRVETLINELETMIESSIIEFYKNGNSPWVDHINNSIRGLDDILEKWNLVRNVMFKDDKTPEEKLADAAQYFLNKRQ